MIANGVLEANEVEIREGNSEFKAFVESRDLTAQILNIAFPGVSGTIPLKFDIQSVIEDETPSQITLSEVQVGDDVKVRAREMDNQWQGNNRMQQCHKCTKTRSGI